MFTEGQIQEAACKSRQELYDDPEFYQFSSSSDAQDHGFHEGVKWANQQHHQNPSTDGRIRASQAIKRTILGINLLSAERAARAAIKAYFEESK